MLDPNEILNQAQLAPRAKIDIPRRSWIDALLPKRARPFARLARLDRPIGTWLLLLPGWWALAMAGFGVMGTKLMFLFLVGAVVMRGAGCTYNDIVDRDIDARVARTATRPLPAGEVTLTGAWIFLGLQLAIGLLVLLQLNRPAIIWGAASLLLVASYPFMKRITYWPQLWLGLTFNWGALVGWVAQRGQFETAVLPLYVAGIFWTLGYDTIYAHQDREDDALAGVKSSALALGRMTKPFVALFYAIAFTLIAYASARIITPNAYGLAFLAAAGLHLVWQVATLNINDPANCLVRFKSNRDFGLLVLGSILAQRF